MSVLTSKLQLGCKNEYRCLLFHALLPPLSHFNVGILFVGPTLNWGQGGGECLTFIICEITVFVNRPIAFDRVCSIRNYPHSPNVMWVKSKVCFPLGKFLCVKQKFAVKKQEHFLLFHGEFFADESRCCIFVFASHEQIRLVEKRLYFMV